MIEPGWLTARRERAVSLKGSLALPSFRGTPGWEFTSLKKLDLDAFEKPARIGAHIDVAALAVVDAPEAAAAAAGARGARPPGARGGGRAAPPPFGRGRRRRRR